jgi:hydrogenase maturation protease
LKHDTPKKILLIGYGNPAREDDGLGPAAAEAIEAHYIEGITVEANYQLTVEDAATVAEHDIVVFIDATTSGNEPFDFLRLRPKQLETFNSHLIEPETVLGLAQDLFTADTEAYMLGIRGYSFTMFQEHMTAQAQGNLEKAINFLLPVLLSGAFQQAAQQLVGQITINCN